MNTIGRPPLSEKDVDYSRHHDPLLCAVEINLSHVKITKVGHIAAILNAHFPNVRQLYEAVDAIKRECVTSRSPLAKRILALLPEVQP